MNSQITFYELYMRARYLGRSLHGPGTLENEHLALIKGYCLTLFVFCFYFIFWGPGKGSEILLIFNSFLACDALHASILKLHNYLGKRIAKRDFDKNILVLANAMPYTLKGTSGTAILFIHGFGDTPETWQLIAPRVHSLANVTCRAMRLPFIANPLSWQHHAHLDNWLDAIREEMAELRRWNEKVFIAGHGMGAGLALLFACENPKLVDGVVALSPLVRAKRASKILFWLADNFSVFTRVAPNPFRGVIKTADGRTYRYAREHFTAFAIFRAFFQMTSRLDMARERSAAGLSHRLPVLVFVSERDHLIDVPAARRFLDDADILEGAHTFTTKKAGHFLTLDVGWEKRAGRIAAFVENPLVFE